MTISIRDVARHLNLSITTVSRAINNYDDVSEETRQRVLQAVVELGYTPNRAARQLRHKYSDTIGYILPAAAPRFLDPFFAEFIAGLGDESSKHGLDLLVSTAPSGSRAEQQAYEKWLHGHKVDGIVLNRMHLKDWRVEYLVQNKFPFVTLERSIDPHNYPSVEINGRRWFKTLIDHLVSLGHQRIAYIGADPELKIQADRFAGYQDGLQSHALADDSKLVVVGDLSSEGGYRAGKHLLTLPNPPTAITCIDDMTAIGVLHVAREMGWIVGQNLAVTGFDGIEGFKHTQPPLTTINQPVYMIACRLVQMLVDQIAGNVLEGERVQLEPVLEIRQSTAGK
jgi:LacI family transcriptional regulator, galactose operon repressor